MNEALSGRWANRRKHAKQIQFLASRKRFIALDCGRGSGKTDTLKMKMSIKLFERKPWPDPRYFFGAPTEGQAKRIAWNDFKMLIPRKYVASISESEMKITTTMNSMLQVVGLDKPQRVEGVQWDGCGVDESADIRPGTFALNILPALTHRNGWCVRSGVPKRQGIGAAEFREFCERAGSGEMPDAERYTWPSSDILTPAQLAYMRETMDPKDFREQFEASWEDPGGIVFWAFDGEANVRPCTYNADKPLVIGSDFNVDPMAWCIGHRYQNRMEWIDEIWLRNTNTRATLDVLWQRYQHHKGGFEFYGDASGGARKTSASSSDYQQIAADERFAKAGRVLRYPSKNPDIEGRFSACNAMLLNADGDRRMFIDPRCKHLIDDLKARYYKPGTRDVADKGDLGHITDAMGYAIHQLFPIRIETENKGSIYITTGAQ
jgi:hypothetical protein